jgi:hypothetical protein
MRGHRTFSRDSVRIHLRRRGLARIPFESFSGLYWIRCQQQKGWTYQQPASSSGVEGDYAVLRNVNGIIARYRITEQRGNLRLTWVDPEAEES